MAGNLMGASLAATRKDMLNFITWTGFITATVILTAAYYARMLSAHSGIGIMDLLTGPNGQGKGGIPPLPHRQKGKLVRYLRDHPNLSPSSGYIWPLIEGAGQNGTELHLENR